MTVEYTNRVGQTYYLHKTITKRGNFRYYFSKDNIKNLAPNIPSDYEIYENPSGQVFLRKKSNSYVAESDVKLVEKLISEQTDIDHFFISCHENILTLYLPDIDIKDMSGMLNITMVGDNIKLNQFDPGNLTYSPYINIIFNKQKNIITLEKVDKNDDLGRWQLIDSSDDLESLIRNNLKAIQHKTYSNLKILFL